MDGAMETADSGHESVSMKTLGPLAASGLDAQSGKDCHPWGCALEWDGMRVTNYRLGGH